ncbi:MAG: phage portal protein [Methylococcales bacterium]|nr:phage portal protein [Methylococcales bacterium]
MKRPRSFSWKPKNNLTKMDADPQSLAFDSGGTGKRSQDWGYQSYSPNSAISESGSLIVERSREAIRKNAFVYRARLNVTSDMMGSELTPHPISSDANFNDKISILCDDHQHDIVIGEQVGLQGLFFMALMAEQTSGECFIVKVNRPLSTDLTLPYQVKILESDFCPLWYNAVTASGNIVKNGIEFNKNTGERVAYWLYMQHPNELNLTESVELVRVLEKDVCHYYIPDLGRIGQIRATPSGVQSLVPLRQQAQFEDFELEKAASMAGFVGFIRRATPPPEVLDQMIELEKYRGKNSSIYDTNLRADSSGVADISLAPNTINLLADDEQDPVFAPAYNSTGGNDFSRRNGHRTAAGMRVSYHTMTGNYEGLNDRILRFAANADRRLLSMLLNLFFIPQVARKMHGWACDAAVLSGKVKVTDYAKNRRDYTRVEFDPEAQPYLLPLQDLGAKKLELELGLEDKDTMRRKRNRNPIVVDKARAEIMRREKELGLDVIGLMNDVNNAKAAM